MAVPNWLSHVHIPCIYGSSHYPQNWVKCSSHHTVEGENHGLTLVGLLFALLVLVRLFLMMYDACCMAPVLDSYIIISRRARVALAQAPLLSRVGISCGCFLHSEHSQPVRNKKVLTVSKREGFLLF
jgi:hypothetical protein